MKNYFFLAFFLVNHLFAMDPLAIPPNRTLQLDRIQKLDQELSVLNQKVEVQKAELRLLKDSITGNFETDARLIIKNLSSVKDSSAFKEARYFLDDQEVALITNEDPQKPIVFDAFVKEGKHQVRIDKKYEKHHLTGKTEVTVKPGNTTYLDVVSNETRMKYEIRLVPHLNGRTILPVSDVPHLLPGSPVTQTTLVIFAGRELEPGFKLNSQKLVLDGKVLKNFPVRIEGKAGFILFEGLISPGKHILEATMHFEGHGKPALTSKFKTEFTMQPGFKTSLVLTNNKKFQVEQEAL